MKRRSSVLILLLGIGTVAYAQHGHAPNGYYPLCYAGDMWTGVLSAVDDQKSEITLTYVDPKHNKAETFTGVIEDGYTVSRRGGPPHALKPSELSLGTRLTVYYCSERKKVAGTKTTINKVFRIDNVPNLRKEYLVFRAFP
jgi:hypothetical protein